MNLNSKDLRIASFLKVPAAAAFLFLYTFLSPCCGSIPFFIHIFKSLLRQHSFFNPHFLYTLGCYYRPQLPHSPPPQNRLFTQWCLGMGARTKYAQLQCAYRPKTILTLPALCFFKNLKIRPDF